MALHSHLFPFENIDINGKPENDDQEPYDDQGP